MRLASYFVFASMLACGADALAHDYKLAGLHIDHPYARSTVAQQASGAAYLTIENQGKSADKLLSAASPIAASVQFHTMAMDGAVMKMREVPAIELKPAAKVAMQPGFGYHLMLTGLKQQLKDGEKFPLTLNFEKAGKLEVTVNVESAPAKAAAEASMHHSH